MNQDLDKLQPYPFEKLRSLLAGCQPPDSLVPIALSIGEPKHPSPRFVIDELIREIGGLSVYPSTQGLPMLRETICHWAENRFQLKPQSLNPETNVLPVNGTREAIFALTQTVVERSNNPLVVCPNPFYQIYEGATYLAGAEPHFLPCLEENGFIPDFDSVPDSVWSRCQLVFICSPGNPSGAVMSSQQLKHLIELADRHDFIIASDECYSEIYCDESCPPPGLLQACAETGRHDFHRCLVFHSLSKRSNLPGLRSGFVAGDANIISQFLRYRTYHGCAMPIQHQMASIAAWSDENHVQQNRDQYRRKFAHVLSVLEPVLDVKQSDASFYLWPETPIDDQDFARGLFEQQHVTVLPGSYLSRTIDGLNPGQNRVRMALVAEEACCMEAAERIRTFIASL